MTDYYVHAITFGEFGRADSVTGKMPYESHGDAFAEAVDYGQRLAGPVRDGYRRPTVAVVKHETLGVVVKVGDAEVDGQYTLVYVGHGY